MSTSFPNHSSPFFVAQITADLGGGTYTFIEVNRGTGGFTEKVASGRYGSAANPGYALDGATFTVGDFAICRSADQLGGLAWELLGNLTSGASAYPSSDVVWINNTTGYPVHARDWVGLTIPHDPLLDPATVLHHLIWDALAVVPSGLSYAAVATPRSFAIALEDIPVNEIGRGVVQGEAFATVNVLDQSHRRATFNPDNTSLLDTNNTGEALIQWREGLNNGLPERAVVLLEGRVPFGSYYEYKTDCVPQDDGSAINERYQRLVNLETGIVGGWEFESDQGCCDCPTAGSGGSSGEGGQEVANFTVDPAGLPVTIVAGDCVTSPVVVSGLDPTATLTSVKLDVTHPNVGKLTVRLTDPSGNTAVIAQWIPEGSQTSPADGILASFADGLPHNIQSQSGPSSGALVGTFAGMQSLDTFAGSDPNGTWTVEICDASASATGGTFNGLTLCFGDKLTADFTVDAGVSPTSGAAPLTVTADPVITGGTAFLIGVDWGDGAGTEWHVPGDFPITHIYTTDGTFEVNVTGQDDCVGTASDSALVVVGGGGGGTTDTDCCAAVPDTLKVHSVGDGGCVAFDVTSTLVRDVVTGHWLGTMSSGGNTLNLSLKCPPGSTSASDWRLDVSGCVTAGNVVPTSSSCGPPIHLVFPHSAASCPCAGGMTHTITPP